MRLLLSFFLLVGLCGAMPGTGASLANAAACTGDDCPPPQGNSGHGCEGKKQEDTVS